MGRRGNDENRQGGLRIVEESCISRCGMCGAEIKAQHLGNAHVADVDVQIGYCERCNAFAVPIGEDEKPYRERIAEAKRRVPKGWTARECEDGSLELRRGVPCRWLWAFPVGLAGLVFFAWVAANFALICESNHKWPVLLAAFGFAVGIFFWICALFRLTARRYRLGRDALVAESLWLGFIPMCRRRFVRTAITRGEIEKRGKDFVAIWINGYDLCVFWRGRNKEEAEFINANLLAQGETDALNAEPLLCEKCGAEFRAEDIDMPGNSLVCPRCGVTTEPGDADYARLVRFRMHYRPKGVVDIPGGFELRERRWWNGALCAAISRCAVVAFTVASVARLFEKLPAPWVYIPISVLLLLLTAAPVYLVASVIVGRFGVHRITERDGRIIYFHGIGIFGRRMELPLDSIGDAVVIYRGSILDQNASIPSAFAICVNGKTRRTFRDCPPIFYHWVEGWLREARKASTEDAK